MAIQHNVVVDTEYGPFVLNRHSGEFDALAKFGTFQGDAKGLLHSVLHLTMFSWQDAVCLDVGACFGFLTIPLAHILKQRGGRVVAFEPQRWLFHCLCGSVALNGLDNVEVYNQAMGDAHDLVTMPGIDYTKTGQFGSVPVKDYATERSWGDIGQEIQPGLAYKVPMVTVDSLALLPTFIKVDVEGMEMQVLAGAAETIRHARPSLYVEHIKCDEAALQNWFDAHHYDSYVDGCNYIGIPHEKRDQFPPITYGET